MGTMESFRLDGRVAIVTGGAGLYGSHISEALCEAGATVVIASRGIEQCEEKARLLRDRGFSAHGMALDLSSEASIKQLVADVLAKFGRLDILINNAVSRYGLADLEDTTAEGWDTAEQINGRGLMLMSQAVIEPMRQQKKGNIINISSIQGANGPHFPVYGDTGMSSGIEYTYSKWGMIGMTKWMSNYYGKDNIRVNAISPGGYNPVGTSNEMTQEVFKKNYIERTPLGRFANDDDIKGSIVFLASDASSYVTGHNLMLDGGWNNW